MSEVKSEGSNTQAEGQKDGATLATDLETKIKALEATNARLLEESQKAKERAKTATSQVEQAERERLEKEGNYQVLLENERKRASTLEEENKGVRQKVLKSNIQATIARLAGEVHSLDDVLNQPAYSHILKKGINDTDLTLSEEVAKEYLNELFKAKPYLKKTAESTGVITTKPNFQTGEGGSKSIDELSSSEIENILKAKFK